MFIYAVSESRFLPGRQEPDEWEEWVRFFTSKKKAFAAIFEHIKWIGYPTGRKENDSVIIEFSEGEWGRIDYVIEKKPVE